MKCSICNISCVDKPLYRNAPKGTTPADWRCKDHLDKNPDVQLEEITNIVHNKPVEPTAEIKPKCEHEYNFSGKCIHCDQPPK